MMAGSFNHIVDSETGEFTMELIENLGDAHEALEECYHIIKYLTVGWKKSRINRVLTKLNYPHIDHRLTTRVGTEGKTRKRAFD